MSNTNVELFRERFADLRAKSGLSIAALSDKTGISETGLRNYESKKENRMPRVSELIEIAKTFNVSADYLLGLSDVPSLNADIQGVCKYTGLSEMSVKWIKYQTQSTDENGIPLEGLNERYSKTLNTLLEDECFWELCMHLWMLEDASNRDFALTPEVVESNNHLGSKEHLIDLFNKKCRIKEECELSRFNAQEELRNICDSFDKRKDKFSHSEQFAILSIISKTEEDT